MALGPLPFFWYDPGMRLLLALLLLAAASASAKPFPSGADLAAKAKPPKKTQRAKPAKKTAPEPVAPLAGSGYDYFHFMASPEMAAQPVRDAMASPRPAVPKSARK